MKELLQRLQKEFGIDEFVKKRGIIISFLILNY